MPTVLHHGSYSFRSFSADYPEPPHVHVRRERYSAKFWLDPVRLAKNRGYPKHELARIERLVELYRDKLLEAWYDYFGP